MSRALFIGLLIALPGSAFAEPMDLRDPTPRWIEVAFEVSPRDKPAQTDTVYTPAIRAWFEPDLVDGHAVVRVDREDVERVVVANEDPVAGSFSDFVWVFDPETGEVVSAGVSGMVTKEVDWGLFRTKVRTRIEVDMATTRVGGFTKPRRWLGQQLFGYCDDAGISRCRIVAATDYDATSGYVNAVGELQVHFRDVTLHTFSPLGEALFSEVASERPEAPRLTGLEGVEDAVASGSLGLDATTVGAIVPQEWVSAPDVSAGPSPAH